MSLLAKNMLFLRRKTRKNQSQLAFEVQVRPNTISNWENKVSEPSATDILKICQIFNITPNQFLITDLEETEAALSPNQNSDTKNDSFGNDPDGEKGPVSIPLLREDNEPYGKSLLEAILKMSDNIEQMRVVMVDRLPEKPRESDL